MARYYRSNLEISRNSSSIGLKALLQAQCYSVHEDHQAGYSTYQLECVWLKNVLLPIVAALGWHCVECAIQHTRNCLCFRDVREERHPYICGEKNNNSVISSICICCFASCYTVKLCTLAAHAFRSKHYNRKCTV